VPLCPPPRTGLRSNSSLRISRLFHFVCVCVSVGGEAA